MQITEITIHPTNEDLVRDTMKKRSVRLWLPVLLLATVFSQPLYADSPALEHLKTNVASVQQVLNDPKLAGDEHLFQRRKLARTVLQHNDQT